MRKSNINNILPWVAALLVPLFYLACYTPYGMDTTDFGYFYGYGWRILEGQMPYRDFSYIKPALPLYWHAFWLWLTPENWEVLGGKAGFACTLLASAWFGALYLGKLFNLRKLDLPLPLLATSGFVFGIHSFPHMPWHTADGILFSSAALWLGACAHPFISGLLAGCAMLCKQSFLLVPVAILLMIFLWNGSRRNWILFICGWLGILAMAYVWLAANDALNEFRAMTTGQLDIREALDAGIFIYLRQNWWLPLLACIPWCAAMACRKSLPAWLLPSYSYMGILTLWYVYEVFRQKTWIGYGASWPTLFMLLGALCVLMPGKFLLAACRPARGFHQPLAASVGLGAALTASWSVAISGGYKIPAMFATPLLFSFYLVHGWFGGNIRKLAWCVLCCGLLMFGVGYQYPYVFPVKPLQKCDLVHDAGQVYHRASGVMVDGDMLQKLEELKYLRAKYGSRYKTLPGFSHAYYLNGDMPVYSSDWLIDWEINGEVDRFYQELLDKKLTVFMERDQMDSRQADGYARAGYGVPQRVRHNWRIVEETPHFVVMQPPDPAGD